MTRRKLKRLVRRGLLKYGSPRLQMFIMLGLTGSSVILLMMISRFCCNAEVPCAIVSR